MLVNSEMEYQKAIAYIFQLIEEGKFGEFFSSFYKLIDNEKKYAKK